MMSQTVGPSAGLAARTAKSAAMRLAVPALLAVLALAGCGQSDDRDTVRATTERFLAAYDDDQGDVACATLSRDTRKELESQESRPCPEAIAEVELSGGAVTRVEVALTNAKVDLASGESLFFSQQSVGWRITALGCRSAGKPTELPFDCELEA
jgi:hypothetical protein